MSMVWRPCFDLGSNAYEDMFCGKYGYRSTRLLQMYLEEYNLDLEIQVNVDTNCPSDQTPVDVCTDHYRLLDRHTTIYYGKASQLLAYLEHLACLKRQQQTIDKINSEVVPTDLQRARSRRFSDLCPPGHKT